jgi:tRNA uridine 5-carboxymethylaminomethyl modification enzyme
VDAGKVAGLAIPAEAKNSTQGITFAQMLKRPEVTIEVLAPLLVEAMQTHDAEVFAPWLAAMQERDQAPGTKHRQADVAAATGVEGPVVALPAWVRNEMKTVETEIKYAGYLDQQRKTMEKLRTGEAKAIPEWFDYAAVSGLSREMHEKLTKVRPQTLGQASRIPGVTPAALSLLHVYIEIQGRKRGETVQA